MKVNLPSLPFLCNCVGQSAYMFSSAYMDMNIFERFVSSYSVKVRSESLRHWPGLGVPSLAVNCNRLIRPRYMRCLFRGTTRQLFHCFPDADISVFLCVVAISLIILLN